MRFCGVTVSSKGQVAVQSGYKTEAVRTWSQWGRCTIPGYKSEALRTWPHWGRCTIPGYKSEAVRTWPPWGRCTLPGYKSEAVRTWPQWGRCTIPGYKSEALRTWPPWGRCTSPAIPVAAAPGLVLITTDILYWQFWNIYICVCTDTTENCKNQIEETEWKRR